MRWRFLDSLLRPQPRRSAPTTAPRERRWRLMQVEPALSCNLKCIMCPWAEVRLSARNRGVMPENVWRALAPHLPEVASVDFTGGGEPLLQPRLIEWVAEAKSHGCETGTLTNGLLLTRETAKELITAGLDWLCVSLDGATADVYESIRLGSHFSTVCDNLARVAELRRDRVPLLMINVVLMPMNAHQAEELVSLAARLGVDQVNFKQCDVIRGELGKGLGLFASDETNELRGWRKRLSRARSLAKKLNVRTTAFSFVPTEQPVCAQDPRHSLFVSYDGTVAPCINLAMGGPTTFLGNEVSMPSVHYGRFPEEDLLSLWETASCRFYRERFEQRVETYGRSFRANLERTAWTSPNRLKETAVKAMPEAPDGCKVCHYLYDV